MAPAMARTEDAARPDEHRQNAPAFAHGTTSIRSDGVLRHFQW